MFLNILKHTPSLIIWILKVTLAQCWVSIATALPLLQASCFSYRERHTESKKKCWRPWGAHNPEMVFVYSSIVWCSNISCYGFWVFVSKVLKTSSFVGNEPGTKELSQWDSLWTNSLSVAKTRVWGRVRHCSDSTLQSSACSPTREDAVHTLL